MNTTNRTSKLVADTKNDKLDFQNFMVSVSDLLERATVEETGLPAKQIVRVIGLGSEPSLSAKERKKILVKNHHI